MKGSEIYKNLTPEEKERYLEKRREQGIRIAKNMSSGSLLVCVAIFFAMLLVESFALRCFFVFALVLVIFTSKLPKTIKEIRRENRESLAKSNYAIAKGVKSDEIRL